MITHGNNSNKYLILMNEFVLTQSDYHSMEILIYSTLKNWTLSREGFNIL